jgi:fructokinase
MSFDSNKKIQVICFGEILWDALPAGLFPGGAPMNVAYHLERLGSSAIPISAVGKDFLGEDFLRRFRAKGIDTRLVAELKDSPTGVVIVELDETGSASYDFRENSAWDHIPLTDKSIEEIKASNAFLFGTLAQRSESNRKALDRVLDEAQETLKIFDVNFRPPYVDLEYTWKLAQRADWIKLNDDELTQLAEFVGGAVDSNGAVVERLELLARAVAGQLSPENPPTICVTAGADGAGVLDAGEWYWAKGQPVKVQDTVGAGDSFLAALVHYRLNAGLSLVNALTRACRIGEWVASQSGATPEYDPSDIIKE